MFTDNFFIHVQRSISKLDSEEIEKIVDILAKRTGRLFIIGSGGGAGHASHAVCDFRKLCNIESYAPYDNVSELTARINDEGFETSIINWLKVSRFNQKDCIFVLSVGGGTEIVSHNITKALYYAQSMNAKIIGIVGRDGGITKKLANACVVIQTEDYTTAVTEGLQSVIWHAIVTNPKLAINKTVW